MEKGKRVSRIDAFAPTDLRAFIIRDTDIWALMQVVNVHEWKANRGDLKYAVISDKTGWSEEKVGKVAKRAQELGLIRLTNTGHGYIIEKTVEPMTWDEYRALEAAKHDTEAKPDTVKHGIRDRENRTDIQENAVAEAAKDGGPNNKNDLERPNDKNEALSPRGLNLKEGLKPNTPGEFAQSNLGRTFCDMFRETLELDFTARQEDVWAVGVLWKSPLTDQAIFGAMKAFFSPTSWHMKNNQVTFQAFVKSINTYALEGRKGGAPKSLEKMAMYYEPWDPRHPRHATQDKDMLAKMKSNHEAAHGPWQPKPDWKE